MVSVKGVVILIATVIAIATMFGADIQEPQQHLAG
jgi:hypothetical protein